MRQLFFSRFAFIILLCSCSQTDPALRIGLVADPQYANKAAAGNRFYKESTWKLKEAITTFNEHQVDFVQNLGDIIDGDWVNYDSIIPVYRHLSTGIENHHTLGNHDFSIDSIHMTGLLETLSMPDYYYSYVKGGWRFIVLDATDYAFFSNPLHQHDPDQIDSLFKAIEGKPNYQTWNSAMGKEQQKWLMQELELAGALDQKVILFSHMPLRPLYQSENLWNDADIIKIIEDSPQVVAYINGHKHSGGYVLEKGIHYINIYGMVETMANSIVKDG